MTYFVIDEKADEIAESSHSKEAYNGIVKNYTVSKGAAEKGQDL